MATIVVLGAALGGMQTALLLAEDGHDVTVLERDPCPAPHDADAAWSQWKRPGIPQLRLTHFLLARWRQLAETQMPGLVSELEAAGALRVNTLATEPAMRGPLIPGDERFDALTARRPLIEAAASRTAASAKIRIRRGVSCLGFLTEGSAMPGESVPRVTGVATSEGTESADLVVDCTGRRSQLPAWLRAIGVTGLSEESGERGFTYYSRYFRSTDGVLPSPTFKMLESYGSLSVLRVPADNGTWAVCLVTRSDDHDLRALRHENAWTAALDLLPGTSPWHRAEPISDGVQVMAGLKDRVRNLYGAGRPPVTGLVAVGDAWACTNPTVGRGLTMSLEHGVCLRDTLRETGTTDPVALVERFGEATVRRVEPTYRQTAAYSRHRLAEMDADITGVPYRHPEWSSQKALDILSGRNPDALRAMRAMVQLLPGARQALHAPAMDDAIAGLNTLRTDRGSAVPRTPPTIADAVAQLVPQADRQAVPGPSRTELLKAIGD